MWSLYVLVNRTRKSLLVGITREFERTVRMHSNGQVLSTASWYAYGDDVVARQLSTYPSRQEARAKALWTEKDAAAKGFTVLQTVKDESSETEETEIETGTEPATDAAAENPPAGPKQNKRPRARQSPAST